MPWSSYLVMGFKASVVAHTCGSVAHVFRRDGTGAFCPFLLLASSGWESPSPVRKYLRLGHFILLVPSDSSEV